MEIYKQRNLIKFKANLEEGFHILGMQKFRKNFGKPTSRFRLDKHLQVLVSTACYAFTLEKKTI